MSVKTYSELITIPTFEERFEYLRIGGRVGDETFGFNRYLNQVFYRSPEWRRFRREIILRDSGCDLGILDREIHHNIIIHHIVPISMDDIANRKLDIILNPDNVVCTSDNTHKAIHYSDESLLMILPLERSKNDTCPWKQG